MKTFTIEIKKEVTETDLHDILADATYACAYWCSDYEYNSDFYAEAKAELVTEQKDKDKTICLEDVLLRMILKGKDLGFYNNEEGETHYLTLDKLLNGIKLNVEQRPDDCNLDTGDATTTDCIIQFALFGEVVYG